MIKIKKSDLPNENIPEFKKTKQKNCYKLENSNVIHSYAKFDSTIIQQYMKLFKDEHKKKFEITCKHMFKKVGYGIFIFILTGKIHTFQIFANTTEIKPGSNKITKNQINKYQDYMVKNKTKKSTYLKNKKNFGFSNCMVNMRKNWWNSFYTHVYFDMLNKSLKNSSITTCFFLNLYDYPVLYNKKCGQYILSESICKNNSNQQNEYIPVLSGATTNNHYDKCLVCADAWEIISKTKFSDSCRNNYFNLNKVNQTWKNKTNCLMFRGKNNSCYQNDFKKNERLKVLKIMNNIKNNNQINIDIDVGLVNVSRKSILNTNDEINSSNSEFILNNIGETNFVERISMPEQSNCKYIVNIDGYVTAWRLCYELSYNSCIILFLSKYYSWFYDKLEHMKNVYIIDIYSKTLEKDIYDCLITLQENNNIGKKIANGSLKLFNEIMNIKYVKKYMCDLLSGDDFDLLLPIED